MKKKGLKHIFGRVRAKKIGFCTHCDYCLEHKECAFKDDMQEVYTLLKKAKGIIFATPVYNGSVSAQTKAVMDRCRALVAADPKFFKNKVGIGIALGGDRIGGQEIALQQILNFYILNGAVPISGGFFGANLGATFWTKDSLDGVKQDDEGFRSLRKTVKKFADFLNNSK